MKKYKCYYVDGCEKKDVWHLFLRVLLAYSDAFSLIFFKYAKDEVQSEGVSQIERDLLQYKINERIVKEWPGTTLMNERHYYRMVTYRIDSFIFNVLDVLEKVNTIWEWSYPLFPMDICFYKKGIAWFVTSTHEHWNALYLLPDGSFPFPSDLESAGIHLVFKKNVPEGEIYSLNQRDT